MDFIHYVLRQSFILIAETIIYWIFYNGIYERRQRGWKNGLILFLFPISIVIGGYCSSHYGLPIGLKAICIIITGCIITKLLFYANWRNIIANQWIWLLCSVISDSFSMGILTIVKDYVSLNEILNNPSLTMQAEILAKTINIVFILIFSKKLGKETSRYTMTETLIFLLQGISGVTSIVLVIEFSINNITNNNNKIPTLCLIIISILILISYIVFYSIFDRYIKKRNIEHEVMNVHYYNQGQYEYYAELERENFNIRKMYHDMKNHLLAIQGLNNDSTKISNTYIQKCLEVIEGYNIFYNTGNRLADIIFYEKCNIAKNHNIKTKIMIQKNSLNNLDMIDLCTILTNSFDNAMEACKQCKGNRFIQVKTIKNDGAVILTFKNNYEILPELNTKGELITSKRNKAEHGIGMQSLKMAASKYNGDVEISIDKEKKEFLLIVMIPIAYQKAS